MRDSIVFYRSFYEAIKGLPDAELVKSFKAIMEYGLNGVEPEGDGIEKTVFLLTKPQIDVNNHKYENGKKGGRPKNQEEPNKNLNETTEKPKNNQEETKAEPNVNDNVNVNANVNDVSNKRFTPPTLENVIEYCREKGYNVDAERFIDFYESKGWMVGKNKMKDWKAAVRNWGRQTRVESVPSSKPVNKFNNFEGRSYDFNSLERELLREAVHDETNIIQH